MTRPVLDGTRCGPDPANVPASRRHRLIWTAVAGVHLAAVAAVWMGGALGVSEASLLTNRQYCSHCVEEVCQQ